MKKATLGRGLDALIPKENPFLKGSKNKTDGYVYAKITDIRPNPNQPRRDFADESLVELALSIKEKGVLQPLVVKTVVEPDEERAMGGGGARYEIIAGERRWRAAQRAGVAKVPIVVKEILDGEVLELALIENLQREDLNPMEEAMAYQQLIEGFGLTHDEASRRIGKHRSTITNQLRLLKLPDEARRALINEEITAGHARAMLSLDSHEKINEALEIIRKRGLSVRETESLVRKMSRIKRGQTNDPQEDRFIKRIVDDLKKSLSTQVKILNKNGKGRIEIEFYSEDELERLCGVLLGNL